MEVESSDNMEKNWKVGMLVKVWCKAWNKEESFKKNILEAIDRYDFQSERNTVR